MSETVGVWPFSWLRPATTTLPAFAMAFSGALICYALGVSEPAGGAYLGSAVAVGLLHALLMGWIAE